MTVSDNYTTFVNLMAKISVTDIINLRDFCYRMKDGLNLNDIRGVHCEQDFEEEMDRINDLVERLSTGKKCPRCGGDLYVSDLPDYEYVCPYCDENFYGIEVK